MIGSSVQGNEWRKRGFVLNYGKETRLHQHKHQQLKHQSVNLTLMDQKASFSLWRKVREIHNILGAMVGMV